MTPVFAVLGGVAFAVVVDRAAVAVLRWERDRLLASLKPGVCPQCRLSLGEHSVTDAPH